MTAVGTWMLDQLPLHLREDDFFCRFVGLFGAMAEATFDHADALPFLADPSITPMAMVHELASWVGADLTDRSVPEKQQRERLARLGSLVARRGTRQGLEQLLRVLTDGPVTVDEDGGVFGPNELPDRRGDSVVRVRVASTGPVPLDHFVGLVSAEIPADCTLELWVGGERVGTSDRQSIGGRSMEGRSMEGRR